MGLRNCAAESLSHFQEALACAELHYRARSRDLARLWPAVVRVAETTDEARGNPGGLSEDADRSIHSPTIEAWERAQATWLSLRDSEMRRMRLALKQRKGAAVNGSLAALEWGSEMTALRIDDFQDVLKGTTPRTLAVTGGDLELAPGDMRSWPRAKVDTPE